MRGNIARDLASLMAQDDAPTRTAKARTIIARHSSLKSSIS